jgi:phytol kinase
MIALLLTVTAVFAVLLVSEWGWRRGWLANELGRKFVHILVGSFVAFWPFFLTWGQIRFLSAAFLLVVIFTTYFKVFHAIHSVQRPTYGEFFFAATVGLLACITVDKAVYAAAILQMSLADGFAALVGVRYGQGNKYYVLRHAKSMVGSFTFLGVSILILTGYSVFSVQGLPAGAVLLGASCAAALENFGVLGLDNLLVPLFTGWLLMHV